MVHQVNIVRSVLINNTAELGGGVFAEGTATASITGSSLTSNMANQRGGGVHVTANASLGISHSLIARTVLRLVRVCSQVAQAD